MQGKCIVTVFGNGGAFEFCVVETVDNFRAKLLDAIEAGERVRVETDEGETLVINGDNVIAVTVGDVTDGDDTPPLD